MTDGVKHLHDGVISENVASECLLGLVTVMATSLAVNLVTDEEGISTAMLAWTKSQNFMTRTRRRGLRHPHEWP